MTAAHCVCFTYQGTNYDAVVDPSLQVLVAPLEDSKQVPRWRWRATIASRDQLNKELDLAALVISSPVTTLPPAGAFPRSIELKRQASFMQFQVHEEPGRADWTQLVSSRARLGSVSTLAMGDHLGIWGFPSAGGDSVTRGSCTCDGFVTHDEMVTAVKTHAAVDNGFSGGPVLDASGAVVGVLSSSLGKVDYIRPVDAAVPLIAAAEKTLPR